MKQKSSITPRTLQILFIASTSIFFASQVAFNVYYFILGLNGSISSDYTSIYLSSLLWMIIPVIVWAIVHFTRRDRKLSVHSFFQSLLLTFCALLAMTTLGSVGGLLSSYIPLNINIVSGMWWYTLLSIGIPLVIVICGLVMVIMHLRRKKQW